MWEELKRDPVLRVGIVVACTVLLLSTSPLVPAAARESFETLYSDTPLLLVCLVAIQHRRRELAGAAERRFWDLWTAALCCWLSVKLVDALVGEPRLSSTEISLIRHAGFVGFYALVAAALEVRPHRSDGPGTARMPLAALGTSILALGLYAYAVLIPAALVEGFRIAVPGVLLYTAFDVWVVSRLASLFADSSPRGRWRSVYGGLLIASIFWFGSDVVETMMWTGRLPRASAQRLLDLFWLPPFAGVLLAARIHHLGRERQVEPAPPRSTGVLGPLVLQAAALPLLHLALSAGGWLHAETVPSRAAWAAGIGLSLTILAVVHDRAIERELVRAREEAEAASRAKSRFLANISHELRTPLSGVLGATDLLLEGGLSGREKRLAEILRLSAESLLTDIDEILDFSRIESDHLKLKTSRFSPARLVEETVDLLAEAARRKGLDLIPDAEPSLPESITGDPARIRQVLLNLAGNAIKFTEKGCVVVRASVEGTAGDPRLRLTVEDTGIGIPPEAREEVFEAFQQADGSSTRRYGGTGLGLSISRRLARLMGGELSHTSREGGGGTTFVLTLPLRDASVATPGPADSKARVLVLAPLPALAGAIGNQLVRLGCAVELAATAGQALERLRRAAALVEPFGAVILDDRSLAGAPGTLAEIRGDAVLRGLKVVVLSSGGPSGSRVADGADAILEPPAGMERIRETLAPLLEPAPRAPGGGGRSTQASLQGRVLVVEDDAVNREVAIEMVRSLGLRARAASDGREALEALERERFDVVLMDCMMPGLDGPATAAEIRRREERSTGGRVPIIALTAAATSEDRERAFASGMDDYLAKPIRRQELRSTLGAWLSGAPPEGPRPATPPSGAGELPTLDESALLELDELAGGTPSVRTRVLAVYRRDSRRELEEIDAAAARGDAAGLRRTAHSLKSATSQVGGRRLAEICLSLERAARSGELDQVEGLLVELRKEHARLLSAFERFESQVAAGVEEPAMLSGS